MHVGEQQQHHVRTSTVYRTLVGTEEGSTGSTMPAGTRNKTYHKHLQGRRGPLLLLPFLILGFLGLHQRKLCVKVVTTASG